MPRHARKTDPETSKHKSAGSEAFDQNVRERILYLFYRNGRMTDEEVIREYERKYGYTPHSTIRTRRKELEKAGKVKDTGELGRVVTTGRRCIIWEPVHPVLDRSH